MERFFFDVGTQFGAQRLIRHQIHRAAKQVFQVELDAEIALRCRNAVERDEDVDVAVVPGGISCGGAEQCQVGDVEALH
jgi:hypothetical protein